MVESTRFTAIDIASEADTESLDRYGQNIDYYVENDYTYIPMPEDEKFYDRDEGVLKELREKQWVEKDDSLTVVLEKLREHPFLLIERYPEQYFSPSNSEDEESETIENLEEVEGEDIGNEEETNEEESSLEIGIQFKGPDADGVAEDFAEHAENELFGDLITAKEYFQKYPEKANEELDSLYSIITLADLNRRTVKQIAYPTIAELADILSQQIQSEYPNSDDLYPQLRPTTIGNWIQNKEDGLNVHIAEYMNLMEMKQIIVSSNDDFVNQCGFSSKTKCREKLGSVNELRKKVMHANRTLVHNREDINDTLKRIETAQEIVQSINE